MLRTRGRRQAESAHSYLDLSTSSTALDAAAQLVADTLEFPSAQINILDGTTQYTLAHHGPATKIAAATVPQVDAVCAHTIDAGRIVEIPDARRVVEINGSGGIANPVSVEQVMDYHGLSSYVGVPLVGREGLPVGTLCVFDNVPHAVSDAQRHRLGLLATLVEELLDAHRNRTRPPLDHADAAALNAALTAGTITPWYQPIVDVSSGKVVAIEALARWNHPTRGTLTPAHFLAVAEASELIIDLDLTIFARSLTDLRKWHEDDESLRLHVNLSGAHFAHPDCVDRLTTLVGAAGITPDFVVLEITELWELSDNPSNAEFVAALRRVGFEVVLDDLGSGWSSVDRLLEFPLAGFKVDKSVTDRLGTTAGDATLKALHTLAADLGLHMTVEGVETAGQASALAALGSVRGQGYWWARPVPPEEIAAYLGRDLHVEAAGRIIGRELRAAALPNLLR